MKNRKKDGSQRTKVVIRHLPPTLSQFHLFSLFDHLFSHRYIWFCFRPGTSSSQKHRRYSRAYIDFKSPEDVAEFANFFHGHVFVNEKGSQFKAIVEYAPSQRVPKPCTIRDTREGTIYKDPDYLEFLKHIAKPMENLPSAETKLERKEAEQCAAKETPITTPLMEFVRQKRVAEHGNQASLVAVKGSKQVGSASENKLILSATKGGAQKKKHILKGSAKNSNHKSKSAILFAPKQEDLPATMSGKETPEIESASSVQGCESRITVTACPTKKKILPLKGKECEISPVSGGMLQPPGNSPVSVAPKRNQRFKASERLTKSALLNKEACQNNSLTAMQPQHNFQNSNLENDKRLPQPMNKLVGFNVCVASQTFATMYDGDAKRTSDGKFLIKDGHSSEKREKITRNEYTSDRAVRASLCHSDVRRDNEKQSSSAILQHPGFHSNSVEGSHRHFGHKAAIKTKNDGFLFASDWKSSRRGGASSYASQEKRVWVQKSSSGS